MSERLKPMKPLARPARLRAPAIKPTGPRSLRVLEQFISGPGQSPPGFVGGQNSETEWVCYWALFKIFAPYDNPREPPYFGHYPEFEYQSAEMGGYVRALGSAVVDFLVHYGQTMVAIRIQTERYHQYTTSKIQANDMLQRSNLSKTLTVVDVYDQDILGDPTGAKAVVNMKRALGLIEDISPVSAGTAIRAARLKPMT